MPAKAFALALVAGLACAACASGGRTPLSQPAIIAGSYTAERQPDGNTIIFEDSGGLVVIDTGRHLDHQRKIVEFAMARGKPVTTIVNTHWHLDHSGGNAEIRAAYPTARLYASNAVEAALEGFLARSLARSRARLADPNVDEAEKAEVRLGVDAIEDRRNLIPDVTVTDTMPIAGDGRGLELHLARNAATAGDVWIRDPATRTVVAGDLVVLPAPFFDTGCSDGWQDALAAIAATSFDTLVPGHGPSMTRDEFDRYHSAFDALVGCALSDALKQSCVDGWLRNAALFLVTKDDRKNAHLLLDYYIDEIIRKPEKRSEFCHGD